MRGARHEEVHGNGLRERRAPNSESPLARTLRPFVAQEFSSVDGVGIRRTHSSRGRTNGSRRTSTEGNKGIGRGDFKCRGSTNSADSVNHGQLTQATKSPRAADGSVRKSRSTISTGKINNT